MKVQLDTKKIVAFLALLFVMHEAHEIVHTAVGRVICGCWGPRDFNVWQLCGNCSEEINISILATFMGPVFTFGMIWWGFFWMRTRQPRWKQSVGFSLVFANMPFARILTAAMGGGDEVYGLKQVFTGGSSSTLIWLLGLTIVVLLSIVPLIRAFKILRVKYRKSIFTAFFLLPMAIDLLLVLGLMNTLLDNGLLDQTGFLGSPILVNVWTLLWAILLAATWKELGKLLAAPSKVTG